MAHGSEAVASAKGLRHSQDAYMTHVEAMYTDWHDSVEKAHIARIRALEQAKQTIDERRALAKKTFEREKVHDTLLCVGVLLDVVFHMPGTRRLWVS